MTKTIADLIFKGEIVKIQTVNFINNKSPAKTSATKRNITELQVILKVAEQCNLACTYCYYYFMGDDSFSARDPVMKNTLFHPLTEFLAEGIKDMRLKKLTLVFHGGEPMLLKLERFDQLCNFLHDRLGSMTELILSIQTNGTIWNDAWFEVFKKHKVRIGISIDGPKEYHDKYRLDKKSRGTYEDVSKVLSSLKQQHNGRTGNIAGTLSVMDKSFDPRLTVRHLFQEFSVRNMGFLLPDINCDNGLLVGEEADIVGQQLCSLYDTWLEFQNEKLNIREIDRVVNFFQVTSEHAPKIIDDFLPEQKQQNAILVVQSTGHLSVDDSLIPALTWRKSIPSPHLSDVKLSEFICSESFHQIFRLYEKPPTVCEPCEWRNICRGGAPENRFSKINGFDNPTVYCNALKIFYKYICTNLIEGGYPSELMAKKLRHKFEEPTYKQATGADCI